MQNGNTNHFDNDYTCDFISNNNGTIYDEFGTRYVRNDASDSDEKSRNNTFNSASSINIYRYKFTQEFMNEIYQFAKIHQYDERKDFKEAWEIWMETQSELINSEVNRLTTLNYQGDIIDKMFKSARYYFRKKGTVKKEPVQRSSYVAINKDLLDAMDEHILSNVTKKDYKPSDGFVDFCNTNIPLLKEEVLRLFEEEGVQKDAKIIEKKIKKTYKNRYFIMISNSTTKNDTV
jgi:Fe-S cluster biosynthesis and repair protein YggX